MEFKRENTVQKAVLKRPDLSCKTVGAVDCILIIRSINSESIRKTRYTNQLNANYRDIDVAQYDCGISQRIRIEIQIEREKEREEKLKREMAHLARGFKRINIYEQMVGQLRESEYLYGRTDLLDLYGTKIMVILASRSGFPLIRL